VAAAASKTAGRKQQQAEYDDPLAPESVRRQAEGKLQQRLRQTVDAHGQADAGRIVATGIPRRLQHEHRQHQEQAQHAQGKNAGQRQAGATLHGRHRGGRRAGGRRGSRRFRHAGDRSAGQVENLRLSPIAERESGGLPVAPV
jgi:hypothetical protein